jgi:hypothetical protein
VAAHELATLETPVRRVITENEINRLSFPEFP